MNFIIATHNKKKQAELQRVLSHLSINILSADDLGIKLTEVEENGKTFEENARIKALSGLKDTGIPCIADDSGLCVDALGGAPGIYSARYGGENTNDKKNNQKLLSELKDVPYDKRTARFVCCICCVFPDGREINVRGECEGKIAFEEIGNGGFGYDPLFVTEYGCFGDMTSEEKDKISHRGNALKKLEAELKKINAAEDRYNGQ